MRIYLYETHFVGLAGRIRKPLGFKTVVAESVAEARREATILADNLHGGNCSIRLFDFDTHERIP